MKIKALKSFSGILSMYEGQVVEYDNKVVLDDLLKNQYIEEVSEKKIKAKKTVKKNENK